MEHTILMSRKFLTLVALATATVANAEMLCSIRSNTLSSARDIIERRTDPQNTVVPLPSGQFRCTVTFRAQIRGLWHDAEGQAIHTNQAQACAQALNSGSVHILTAVSGTTLTTQEEMVCTDQSLPKTRTVEVGEIIRESEVNPDIQWPHPVRLADGYTYRRFIEPTDRGQLIRGTIRQLNKTDWQVVAKW
jgi:hypothetical protein